MLPPQITQPFAQAHDTAITLALAQLLDTRELAPTVLGIAPLPLHLGVLGLTGAPLATTWLTGLPNSPYGYESSTVGDAILKKRTEGENVDRQVTLNKKRELTTEI